MTTRRDSSHTDDYPIVLGDRGRMVLPAPVRARLGLQTGDRFLARVEEDGSVRLVSFRQVAEAGRGLYAGHAAGRSLSDELVAERRAEAAQQEAG